jgi:iron complex outermembrane receptor protein
VWTYNPQVSVSYTVSDNDTVYLTFADRGRFPMLKDSYSYSMGKGVPNPDLKPEHSRNWNIGYTHLMRGDTRLEVVLYRSDLRDAIESVYVADTTSLCSNTGGLSGYCSQNLNIGKEVHEGVEFGIHTTPVSRVTVDASYSYLNRTIQYDFSSNSNVSKVNTTVQILPTLPKNKLVGSATVRLPYKAVGVALVRYEGGLIVQDTTYSSTSRLYQPFSTANATVDLGGTVPFYKTATLQAGVKNLLDRNYFYVPGFPETGRNWYLNLRYQF